MTGISSESVVCPSSLTSLMSTLKPTCECRPPELQRPFSFGRFSIVNSVDIVRSHSRTPDSVRNSEFGMRENGFCPVKSKIEAPRDFPT